MRYFFNSFLFSDSVPEPKQRSGGTANITRGLPFVTVYDVQFGSFQANNS